MGNYFFSSDLRKQFSSGSLVDSLCPRIIYVEGLLSHGLYFRFGMGFRFLSGAFAHEALMFGGYVDLGLNLSGCDLWIFFMSFMALCRLLGFVFGKVSLADLWTRC